MAKTACHTWQAFPQTPDAQVGGEAADRKTYPVAMGALDERRGGHEPVAMVGVAVKLEQHVAPAATGHARGLGRQEAVPGIGRRGLRRWRRRVRPGADVIEGQGLVGAGPCLLLAPARLRPLLASHGGRGLREIS
jgi:hypothetical protein